MSDIPAPDGLTWRTIFEYDRAVAPNVVLSNGYQSALGYWGDRPDDDSAGPCWRYADDGRMWTPIRAFVPERFAEVDEDREAFLAGA
jgi:hypothetical protein